MSLRSRIRTWWKAVRKPAQLDGEIEDELAFHIESYAHDLMQSGMPEEEAFRRAKAELGGLAAQKENCRASWGTRAWDELRADIRYALRMLRKSPGFTAIAIGSLALGIGANTIIFTVTKAVLLDRLAVPHPEELRLLAWTGKGNVVVENTWGLSDINHGGIMSTSFSYPVYQQLRRSNRTLQDVFAFKNFGRMTASIEGMAEVVESEMVSGNYYRALGIQPVLGRVILDADDGAAGSGPVLLISYGYWQRRFGGSPDVIGRKIEVNSVPMTIVGVNPNGFTGAYGAQSSPDIFLPFSMQQVVAPKFKTSLLTDTELWWVLVMGRVRPDVPAATAQVALDTSLSAAVRATMAMKKDQYVPRLLLADGSRGQNDAGSMFAKPVYVLMSLAGFVLLLACANLANLLLARASSRQREMSVRLALGAGRGRLLRQMLTESLLLSLAGGMIGLVIGYFGRTALPSLLSSSWQPAALEGRFDWKVFGFTAVVSVLTGLLFGVLPGWQATRTQVSSGLKDNAQTATQRRRNLAGKTLVITQVALSMLLLVGAGLFLRTLMNLDRTHLGFDPNNILLFNLQLPETRYPDEKSVPVYRQLEEHLAAMPNVDSITPLQVPLIANSRFSRSFEIDGAKRQANQRQSAYYNVVGQDFFKTFNIPLTAGRSFTAADTPTSHKVMIVNEQFVRVYFGGKNPLGRIVKIGHENKLPVEVIGICRDAKYASLRDDPPATFYIPYLQQDGSEEMTFAVLTRMKPGAITPLLRNAVASVDKGLPLLEIRTQNEQIDDTTKQERIFASLTSGFGILALILACIGIYGIMAYTVSRRTNEIGIRMALGAQAGRVLRMILSEAWWLAAIGIAIGLGGAIALGRLVTSMLYGLKPHDPSTLGMAALLLALVALAASWIPARRASTIDPLKALRHE